ncbi:hypothetical protein ACQR1W_18680 [Bradyrhizobium sp. HKCCYLS1011]|uniref:hypothetical protein n=1 Tax=Bradyrhizobium sp. HKCCYLS1011 TaxID=3420733 RepID=UPI003EBFE5D2
MSAAMFPRVAPLRSRPVWTGYHGARPFGFGGIGQVARADQQTARRHRIVDPITLLGQLGVDGDGREFRLGTSYNGTSVAAEMIFGFSFDIFAFALAPRDFGAVNESARSLSRKFHIFTLFFSSAMLTSWQTQLISPCINTCK